MCVCEYKIDILSHQLIISNSSPSHQEKRELQQPEVCVCMSMCLFRHWSYSQYLIPLYSLRDRMRRQRDTCMVAVMRGELRTGAAKRSVCVHVDVKTLKGHSHRISVYGLRNYVTSVYGLVNGTQGSIPLSCHLILSNSSPFQGGRVRRQVQEWDWWKLKQPKVCVWRWGEDIFGTIWLQSSWSMYCFVSHMRAPKWNKGRALQLKLDG